MNASVAFFFFLSGILFSWLCRTLSLYLSKKVLKRPGQLGRDTRSKFVQDLSQDRLEEFKRKIDTELARRELL